jgi:hypothetical protein
MITPVFPIFGDLVADSETKDYLSLRRPPTDARGWEQDKKAGLLYAVDPAIAR